MGSLPRNAGNQGLMTHGGCSSNESQYMYQGHHYYFQLFVLLIYAGKARTALIQRPCEKLYVAFLHKLN